MFCASAVVVDSRPAFTSVAAAITTAALVGAIFGQLAFGFFADRLGRRAIFIATISLVIIGALGSATCSAPNVAPGADPYAANASVFWQLVFWRSVLGFGVGGEYPLSATVTSESHTLAARGRSIALVFSMQGVGNLLASLVMLACLRAGLALAFKPPGVSRLIAEIGDRHAGGLQGRLEGRHRRLRQPLDRQQLQRLRPPAGERRVPIGRAPARSIQLAILRGAVLLGGRHQPGSRKLSSTRLAPALSNATSSRFSSTAVTEP
jgi:MFS family permease